MRIYLAHPISGLTEPDVTDYFDGVSSVLANMGYFVSHALTGDGYVRVGKNDPNEVHAPALTDQAIYERDMWLVREADIFLVDFTGAERISIGCVVELTTAKENGKHTIVVMQEGNPHFHAFIKQLADVIQPNMGEAFGYLARLHETMWL